MEAVLGNDVSFLFERLDVGSGACGKFCEKGS